MTPTQIVVIVLAATFALFVIIAIARAIQIVPQAETRVVERLGRYSRTMQAGMHLLVPFVDKVRQRVDMREQVVSFPRSR
ncbi:hypothetical protein GCM10025876_36000 [Demequina litorisediminis]|uniref:Band 7 domain-containing protein n=1 Tax=Demequina litorisediminis TaxID=1849022 RepID=A0ABQ6IJV8_9MICO|nr:hypothetical protein GCM10025876_36000 [Demequina litorisediminis]